MNQYPGYGRGATGMQGMGYGVYDDPTSMGRMGHSRGTYPIPQYQDGSQMQRMMHQQGGMYPQDGYMGQHSGNGFSMGGYANYSVTGMSQTPMGNNMSMMMPSRQGEMVRMDSHNNMMNSYYSQSSGHGMPSEHSSMPGPVPNYSHGQNNAHSMQSHQTHMARQGHMSMSNQGQISTMSGPGSNQSPMPGQAPSQASVNLHGQGNPAAHSPSGQATSQAQLPPGRGHPMTSSQSSSGFPGQGSPHMPMMPHRQPTQGPVMSSMPGSGTHQIPQHPMRHPNNQQNPQEVADNILQIASSYPTNQTVQVPLKSRPAPYHIPRSPHYSISHSSDMSHPSPNPHHQQQQSPAASSSQPSPTPSSSSVKSPTPVLAPIPNPIPSPGISGLRSPCNQGISPCNTQRSPVHMGSMYTGHGQAGPPPHMGSDQNSHQAPPPPDIQQHLYSPAGVSPAQNYGHFSPSPSGHRNTSLYSTYNEPCSGPGSDKVHYSNTGATAGHAPPSSSSSPCINSRTPQVNHSHDQVCVQSPQQGGHDGGNNPLMSLQKLVMLPETQVVDPKSVVNDACLSSQQPESNEGPKNVENPAEGLVEGSGHSVGCSGQSSPLSSQPGKEKNPQESSSVKQAHLINCSERESQGMRTMSDKNVVSNQLQNGFVNHEKSETFVDCSKSSADSDVKTTISSVVSSVERTETKCVSSLLVEDTTNVESKEEVATINQQSSTEKEKGNTDQTSKCFTENSEESLDKTEEESNKMATDIEKNKRHLQMNGDPVVHSLEKKSPKMKDGKEEMKRSVLQCRSTSVLSEVPVVTNGLNGNACGSDEELEQECGNGVHPKVQNSFTQLVRAKLGYAKKASSLVRTTPCSIAVGADEREACERFAFRRNGYCRTLRTSRIIYNGRSRTDSTGNADSDESVENVSDSSFQVIGNPQDGNRKRNSTAAKRGDYKNSSISQVAGSNKKSETAPKSSDMKNDSNGCVAYNNSNGVSDDEEMLYYEGVDSSDFFINSSDESVVSNGDTKHNALSLTPVKSAGEKSNETDLDEKKKRGSVEKDIDSIASISNSSEQTIPSTNNILSCENVSSPPAKRLRFSGGKTQEKSESPPTVKSLSGNSHLTNVSSVIDLTEETSQKKPETVTLRKVSHVDTSSNGSGPLQSVGKRKPLILGKKTSPTCFKLPQAIVVLEKADAIHEASVVVKEEKIDINISDGSSHVDTKQSSSTAKVTGIPTLPAADLKSDVSEMKNVKIEEPTTAEIKDLKPEIAFIPKASSQTVQKKKPQKKGKGKRHSRGKSKVVKHTKQDDVKDSFKSMKFSRTLDLMKSRRKRDSTSGGPFLRLIGTKSRPQSVTVFNQSPHASLALGLSSKHKNSRGRQSHHVPATATVHMISSLPSDKVAMVSSTRTISQKPWVCAFCGHRSSYRILGDLFGPYYKETQVEEVEKIAQEEVKRADSSKEDKGSDVGVSTRKGKDSNGPSKTSRRRKSQKSDTQEPEPPEEIWVHETCALWAAGVYLIGSKLYGLDDAVRDASETICSVCKSKGAMMGCLHKGCSMKYHCLCAVDKECLMDEENLSLLCPKHKEKRLSSQGLPSTSGAS